jgi:hypothetical protein
VATPPMMAGSRLFIAKRDVVAGGCQGGAAGGAAIGCAHWTPGRSRRY